ncbi:zinc finger BED domain-containing protein 4-like [Pseudorasbora parva]|uniref:zinc finger BED domain-containing protein 4-like n=1 Tax=Pseudorasbora parva TaxID=51549 RepID=UPI00351F50C8
MAAATDEAEASTSCNVSTDDNHPWPYLKEMFSFAGVQNDSYRMQCLLCLPRTTKISAFKNSSSNLRKHIERKHPNHLNNYSELTSTSQKRKNVSKNMEPLTKQLKIGETKIISQATVDKAVLRFIVYGLQPFSVVEKDEFKGLIHDLQPKSAVRSRSTICAKIEEAAGEMKKSLTEAMRGVEYICTTTDCWSSRRRSFIGMTAHWIDPNNLHRCSAALACRQLKGSHTFDVLAAAIHDIHSEFEIHEKVVCITTDNGSNFLKAFRVYGGENKYGNNAESATATTSEDEYASDTEDEEKCEEIEYVEVSEILALDDLEFHLPKNQRCACHLLNLVSAVDVDAAQTDETYKRLSRSSFSKCWALWNKSGRSNKAAEMMEEECSLQLIRPNATRWNSLFLSVERILKIMKEKGDGAFRNLCAEFKIPMFTPAEKAFLGEYVTAMAPVAKAINILQGENNVHMGWLVPTLNIMVSKLKRAEISMKLCKSLVDAILAGVTKRFGDMLNDPELIAAAILLPKFKTYWTTDAAILKLGLDFIKKNMEETSQLTSDATSSEEEDFFKPLKSSQAQQGPAVLDGYLTCAGDDMGVLKTFPPLLKLSLRLNTPLPASAACERLFSTAGLIFSPKRARINSKNFENQLLLKLNKNIAPL